jgi:hypothetical protein
VGGNGDLRAARLLSWLVVVLMGAVSAVGVFAPQVYRDNALISATFPAQDLVTLVVAVPLLVVGLLSERRGSARGRVVWLGMLFYAVYSYAFYMVGAAFNALFLPYVALASAAGWALVFSLPRLDIGETAAGLSRRGAARLVALVYLGVTAVGLGVLWTALSVGFLATGQVPAPVVASGHPTAVVFALDLAVVVPAMTLAAVWLARRETRGWLLAGLLSVWGPVYTLGLLVASLAVRRAEVGTGDELAVWAALTLLGTGSAALLLAPASRTHRSVAG